MLHQAEPVRVRAQRRAVQRGGSPQRALQGRGLAPSASQGSTPPALSYALPASEPRRAGIHPPPPRPALGRSCWTLDERGSLIIHLPPTPPHSQSRRSEAASRGRLGGVEALRGSYPTFTTTTRPVAGLQVMEGATNPHFMASSESRILRLDGLSPTQYRPHLLSWQPGVPTPGERGTSRPGGVHSTPRGKRANGGTGEWTGQRLSRVLAQFRTSARLAGAGSTFGSATRVS